MDVPEGTGNDFDVMVFSNKYLCDLKVTSGLIGVSDAFEMDIFAGIDAQFPPGNFPVELAITDTGEEELIAFSRIRFSDAPVVRVEQAMKRKAQYEDRENFSVDSATASYFDLDALDEWDNDNEAQVEEVEKNLQASYADTRMWHVQETGNNNIAFFSSGLGDGTYLSYIAFDADNHIAQLITDFGIFLDE